MADKEQGTIALPKSSYISARSEVEFLFSSGQKKPSSEVVKDEPTPPKRVSSIKCHEKLLFGSIFRRMLSFN